MSADFSPNPPDARAELEAKITAWLLGELSADEAARLEELIAKDAELRQLRERLVQTLNLLRETVATPVGETPAQPAPLKLSPARRKKLLAHFKTIRPAEFEKPPRRRISWPVALGIAASLALFVFISIPNFTRARTTSIQNAIVNNLRLIDAAKQQWALEQRQPLTAVPTMTDIQPYLGHGSGGETPSGPGNTIYYIGAVGEKPLVQAETGWLHKKSVIISPDGVVGEGTLAGVMPHTKLTLTPMAEGSLATVQQSNQEASGTLAFNESAPPPVTVAPVEAPAPASSPVAENSKNSSIVLPRSNQQQEFADTFNAGTGSGQQQQNHQQQQPAAVTYDTFNGVGQQPKQAAGENNQPFNSTVDSVQADRLGATSADAPASLSSWQGKPPTESAPGAAPTPAIGGAAFAFNNAGTVNNSLDDTSAAKSPLSGANFYAFKDAKAAEDEAGLRQKTDEDKTSTAGALINEKKVNEVEAVNGTLPWSLHAAERMVKTEGGKEEITSGERSVATANPSGQFPGPASKTPDTSADTNVEALNAVGYINVEISSNTVIVSAPLVTNVVVAAATSPPALPAPSGLPPTVGPSVPIHYAAASDVALALSGLAAPTPLPEVRTRDNAFTTFSLNISDVAFKLAEASLEKGVLPPPAGMRSEEFINAFDYRDPNPPAGAPIGFAWERAGDPFAHHRDFIRFSIKAAAQGREAGRPLNLVLLIDKSGSMERADRVAIIDHALRVLAEQLRPGDTLSVVVFARTARLFVDGVPGSEAGAVAKKLRGLTPEGGTNLEEAMRLAYETAVRHYLAGGENRVVLLTDGAANLGDTDPAALKQKAAANLKQGIALDCFGVGWDGYNDALLEPLSRAGNGRYGFINTPEEADTEFAGKLAGALRVAANDVKVQVEFNPARVTAYRQISYAKDQLKKEDFRNNSVKAAQMGAAEAGNALYTVEINPSGDGPLGTVHVRFRVPGTDNYQEHAWEMPYTGSSVPLDQASPAMRLAAVAAEFSEWLGQSPYAGDVTPDKLLQYLTGVPQVYGADGRPAKLEWMIRQAKSISGK